MLLDLRRGAGLSAKVLDGWQAFAKSDERLCLVTAPDVGSLALLDVYGRVARLLLDMAEEVGEALGGDFAREARGKKPRVTDVLVST